MQLLLVIVPVQLLVLEHQHLGLDQLHQLHTQPHLVIKQLRVQLKELPLVVL